MSMKKIIFCGGGSAGHVVPNLALMDRLKSTYSLSYIGTNGIEKNLVTQAGFPFFSVDTPKLERKFTLNNLKIPFRLHKAVGEAEQLLREEKPDLVFSKGGYAAYPVVAAAAKRKIPVLTHESDFSPGLCTRMIAKKCRYVLTSFEETAKRFPNGRYVGSPIREELFSADRYAAKRKYRFDRSEKPVLLVLGGGSGSKRINRALSDCRAELLKHFQILHICGKGNAEKNLPKGIVQIEYESDMGSAYACADLVLCRAGSNTVFETLALKKRAVFVPLEKNSRGDQLLNARYFEKLGLCTLLRENDLGSLTEVLLSAIKKTPDFRRYDCAEKGCENIVRIIDSLLLAQADLRG